MVTKIGSSLRKTTIVESPKLVIVTSIYVDTFCENGTGINGTGPVAPVAPVEPVKPVAPIGPVGPKEPVDPVAPVKPVGPIGPVGPVGPVPLVPPPELSVLLFIIMEPPPQPPYDHPTLDIAGVYNLI
jgi:hypothetical protein